MPVEIKELIVRFNVTDNAQNAKSSPVLNQIPLPTYKKIIRECSEQVLRSLERKKER
jgi:hypothetical protein